MANGKDKSWLEQIGCRVSAFASDISAHPFAQMGFIIVCAIWFAVGFATDLLTAVLSILAITLTQMVLNRQNEREFDAHRRDVAMHAKLDELVVAMKGARNEMAGIEEELDEEEIEELKHTAIAAIDDAGSAVGDEQDREAAKKALHAVSERLKRKT